MAGKSGTRVEDYLVGAQLAAAEAVTAAGGARDFDIIDPCRVDERTGFEVTDWNALEAVLCVYRLSLLLGSRSRAHRPSRC